MYVKTIFMLSVFFVPLVIVTLGLVSNIYLLMFLYSISGLGMSGVGMCVMHDALHGTYSSNPKINKLSCLVLFLKHKSQKNAINENDRKYNEL